jgi:hypothetical protein
LFFRIEIRPNIRTALAARLGTREQAPQSLADAMRFVAEDRPFDEFRVEGD